VSAFGFTDSEGHKWDLGINYRVAKRVDEADFSVLTPEIISMTSPSGKCLMLWMENTGIVIGTCWVICQEQAEKLDITQEEWESRLNGEALLELQEGFWLACADFFPKSRTVLKAYAESLAANRADQERMMGEVATKLTEARDRMVAEAEAMLSETTEQQETVGTTP